MKEMEEIIVNGDLPTCPWCGYVEDEHTDDDELLVCSSCQKKYHVYKLIVYRCATRE